MAQSSSKSSSARTTIFDVAERAKVSIKTVSRVVNREPNVRDKTRERVERAIAELQDRPDSSARSLARQRSNLIGLVYDDPEAYDLPSSGYIIRLQQGALRACREARHELLIHPCNYRRRDVGSSLKAMIEDARLAGLVLAPPLSNMNRIVRAIQETGTPFVRLSPGHKVRNHLCIATNDREISAEMVDHLAGLGHRRIAFIRGDEQHEAVCNRFDGYLDGLARNALDIDEALVVSGDNSYESGEAAGDTLLGRKHRPSAIFSSNDDMAAGVARSASRLELARLLYPALTTVRQPLSRMAERAVEMLLEDIPSGTSRFEEIPAELQIRGSTGPAPG